MIHNSENLNKALEFLNTKQSFDNDKVSMQFKQWMFDNHNRPIDSFTDADIGELMAINANKGYVWITSLHSITAEGKAFLGTGGWVNKENLENELIENSRKALALATTNNKVATSNKIIARNTFIVAIIAIVVTILTSSLSSKLFCNKMQVSTPPPVTDTINNKQHR